MFVSWTETGEETGKRKKEFLLPRESLSTLSFSSFLSLSLSHFLSIPSIFSPLSESNIQRERERDE